MDIVQPDCAALLLEVAPLVQQVLRKEVRRSGGAELSMPQFRLLSFLDRQSGVSLSLAAERVGLNLSTASKLVETLLARGLVTREEAAADRRRITLAVTAEGREVLAEIHGAAHAHLVEGLAELTEKQQEDVAAALATVRALLERGG